MSAIQSIGLAKEVETSPSNDVILGRVALVPEDVAELVDNGVRVYVEEDAGAGVDYSDADYVAAGAVIQTHADLYDDKDMIVKFNVPSTTDLQVMKRGSILLCMPYLADNEGLGDIIKAEGITLVAMEDILESPKSQSDNEILGRESMAEALAPFIAINTIPKLRIRIIGWGGELKYCLRRGSNRDPRSMKLLHESVKFGQLDAVGSDALYVYDSRSFKDENKILNKLEKKHTNLFDIAQFIKEQGPEAVEVYREDHPPLPFGLRRIECLNEAGMSGARFGVRMLKKNKPELDMSTTKAVVIGYAGLAQGAIQGLYDEGIEIIHVLGRTHMAKGAIDYWLKDADIIINASEAMKGMAGKSAIVSKAHLKSLVSEGSVLIDLIGGSYAKPSPVESVDGFYSTAELQSEQDGVFVASHRDWSSLDMMRETTVKYSSQINDVLLGDEDLIEGLDSLTPGISRAIIYGKND